MRIESCLRQHVPALLLMVCGVFACGSDPVMQLCLEEESCTGQHLNCEQAVEAERETQWGAACRQEHTRLARCSLRYAECIAEDYDVRGNQCQKLAAEHFACIVMNLDE